MTRRLAAIAVADVVGYSRLMEQDEAGTLQALKERRRTILEPVVKAHGGRVVKLMGDGALIEFASAVNAVKGALELQRRMAEANAALLEDRRIVLRIGVNLGDVIGEGTDIYGDGVNVASRLEALAEPGGVSITGKVQEELRGRLALSLEALGEQQLKNIAMPVAVFRVRAGDDPVKPRPAPSPASKPSVAVLPFDNMSGDPEQQYFSDGITEDILTALSRFRSLLVLARNSSFAFRGMQLTIPEIARRLGVTYVLEGSVRKSGSTVRISAQLIEAGGGNHVWSERYDRSLEDVFAVQEEVATAIASTLAGQVEDDVANRASRKLPETFAAYDYALRGFQHHQRLTRWDNEIACQLLDKAIELDPNYAEAHASLALCHLQWWFYDLSPGELELANSLSRRAVELDGNSARCRIAFAYALLYKREFESSGHHHFRAAALNPNDAHVATHVGLFLTFTRRAQESSAWFAKGRRLNPLAPKWYSEFEGMAAYADRRYEDAVGALVGPTDCAGDLLYLVAALGQLGRDWEAERYIQAGRQLNPEKRLSDYAIAQPYSAAADTQHLLDGLRKAGVPE